jgi:hypothetical protein
MNLTSLGSWSVVALIALPSLTMSAPGAAAAGATRTTYVETCLTQSVTPGEITISCADDGRYINHITWSNWGSAQALGRGTLNWNTCTPTCVSGSYRHQSLTFRAQRRGTRGAHVLYLELSGPKGAFGTAGTTWTLTTPHAG